MIYIYIYIHKSKTIFAECISLTFSRPNGMLLLLHVTVAINKGFN